MNLLLPNISLGAIREHVFPSVAVSVASRFLPWRTLVPLALPCKNCALTDCATGASMENISVCSLVTQGLVPRGRIAGL